MDAFLVDFGWFRTVLNQFGPIWTILSVWTSLFVLCVVLEGPHIVLSQHVAVHPDAVGTLVPEKDPSAIPGNLLLALVHRVQPLAAAHVRLPVDIVASLGPAKPEHILLQGESGEGASVRVELSPHPLHVAPLFHIKAGWLAASSCPATWTSPSLSCPRPILPKFNTK